MDSCFDGGEAYDLITSTDYDAAVFDVMMPIMNGFELVKKIRAHGIDTPVLFLTARDSIEDRVTGLDIGADDYLIKPFSFDELSARLRVMTRKKYGEKTGIISVGDLTVDTAARRAERAGREISLSAKEYELLQYLVMNKGVVLSREKIEDHIWNYNYEGGTNVVDVYIRYLRKKIDEGEDIETHSHREGCRLCHQIKKQDPRAAALGSDCGKQYKCCSSPLSAPSASEEY